MFVCVYLEDVIGTLAAQVVLAGQNHHWLGKHLQTDGTDELLLQALHDEEQQEEHEENKKES